MPIEIKELTIRIHVSEGDESQQTVRSSGNQKGGDKTRAELMEDVLEVLRLQKER